MNEIIERAKLITRAASSGCFENPGQYTDQQLRDAIAAEEAAIGWMEKYDSLPDDEKKADAIRRLGEMFRS